MAIEVERVRKVVVFSFGDQVKGNFVTVSAAKGIGGELVEKKTVKNLGHANVSFPAKYSGECFIEVSGSKSGEDSGLIEV